ncbi:serine/threonine protein phosphatase, BSU1, Metallo-dependent phosphatase-like protein [Artemisia annua]|uniref:Serine/threonine protein phosphatase, BSU1, Metallo-dependent phosphatase-like protein n=1 Tax=Artemisia annua TaxID=35608 RepID=A0A2U1QGE0_ARTAN|nr:serine/threonine protein phosphatase, BSU1, Metallo-dependent phosphatase-like protein [Artemisia annua]
MDSKPLLHPAPDYFPLEAKWDTDDDAPGPRCGHTLTAVAQTKSHGPRLILFGGATAIEGGASAGIRLAGVTNSLHSYDVLTKKWTRMTPAGDPPSPRAAHAAAAVGTMVIFQGGIGPAGHSTDDLYVLDLTNDKYKWHRVNELDIYMMQVVIAREAMGNLGGLVRQLSLDHFENESRRMMPFSNDMSSCPAKRYMRQKSPQGLHKKVLATLLKPRNWIPPADRRFFLDAYEVGELCYAAEQIFISETTVLQLKAPIKVFGDLHGQFTDLMRLFDEYGFPSSAGDITQLFRFLANWFVGIQGENDGIWAWQRFNQLFNHLPLAALIEQKIICMHGGIGRSIHSVEQIEKIERPINMDAGSVVLMDLLWSDPTENDSVEGLRPNARGPGLVTFGPDRVTDFCKRNKLQLIIRAHECVMDGFERFAQGQLITLFSATNYCGTASNAGAILVIGRGLVVVPTLIHPLPPPLEPETSPEYVEERHWMQELNNQRPPTPTRGRPQPDHDRSSLAYI